MKILCDQHHSDLAWSLMLLAKRLGATIYFPYGMEWYDRGYFKMYGDLRRKDPYEYLARQYLVDIFYNYDGKTATGRETYGGCLDYPTFNLLTLDQAKQTDIDIVICSLHENEPYFAKLKEFYPKAKFVRQVGNQLDMNIDDNLYPNLLASANEPYEAFKKNKVLYRQEFDMNLFKTRPVINFNHLYTFQNGIEEDERAWRTWIDLKHLLPDFVFKAYGVGNDSGRIYSKREYIEAMLNSAFIFQQKFADGFSHIVHNALALGRIMVLNEDVYSENICAPLLQDMETCLFIEDTSQKTAEKIKQFSTIKEITRISQNAKNRFKDVVSFDREFDEKIKPFFGNLI